MSYQELARIKRGHYEVVIGDRGAGIESLKWRGRELLDTHDLGRLFQVDMVEGEGDLRECVNPTQNGATGGIPSPVIRWELKGDAFSATVEPLDFTPKWKTSPYREKYVSDWPKTWWELDVYYVFLESEIRFWTYWTVTDRRQHQVRQLRTILHADPELFQTNSVGQGWARNEESWLAAGFDAIQRIDLHTPEANCVIGLEVEGASMHSRSYSTEDMVKQRPVGEANVVNVYGSNQIMRWVGPDDVLRTDAVVTLKDWAAV